MRTLGNRFPQWCEVRVNSYVANKQYWQSTRYLVCRGQHVNNTLVLKYNKVYHLLLPDVWQGKHTNRRIIWRNESEQLDKCAASCNVSQSITELSTLWWDGRNVLQCCQTNCIGHVDVAHAEHCVQNSFIYSFNSAPVTTLSVISGYYHLTVHLTLRSFL